MIVCLFIWPCIRLFKVSWVYPASRWMTAGITSSIFVQNSWWLAYFNIKDKELCNLISSVLYAFKHILIIKL